MASKYLDDTGLAYFWSKIKGWVNGPDSGVLHKTGTETVSGEKVFSGSQTTAAGNASALLVVKDPNLVKGETPATNHYLSLGFIDSTGNSYAQDTASRLGVVEYKSPSEADSEGYVQIADRGFNGGGIALIRVGHDEDNIQFATAPATSEDRTDSADIVTRGYMEASEWNWQKTEKAGAVAFKPVPESDLEPVVNFMFTETPPAEGEKGPENPSTITGVAQVNVTRCGKNLFPLSKYPSLDIVRNVNGVDFVLKSTGDLVCNGTATARASFFFILGSMQFKLPGGGTYHLSGMPDSTYGDNVVLNISSYTSLDPQEGYVNQANDTGSGATFTLDSERFLVVGVAVASGVTLNNYTIRPQLELGTTATAFELYEGNDYAIQLGDTYYGGSLDVATGVMTVKRIATTITDSTTFSYYETNTNTFSIVVTLDIPFVPTIVPNECVCDHFAVNTTTDDVDHIKVYGNIPLAYKQVRLYISQSLLGLDSTATASDIVAAAKVWFSSNPTIFVLGLAPESQYTVQLTPTQIRSLPALDKYKPRINTVYTDQEAVQVGYQRYVAEDGGLVHKTGDEVISGYKQFYSTISIGSSSNATERLIIGSVTDGIRIGAESMAMSRHGGMLTLYGKTSTSEAAGNFVLHATNTSSNHALVGRPNGTLTWDDKDITGDVHTTGNNVITAYDFAWRNNDTSGINISGGSAAGKGARLVLCGKSHGNNPGQFILHANNDNGSDIKLIGNPSGTLSWNGQTIQTTSDERLKTPLSEVPDAVLDAWEEVNWGQFRYLDAVAEKGESARLHLGLIAQHVMSVFGKHGLDACAYGILCHEERPAVDEEETVVDAEAYTDEEGVEHPAVTHVETRHEDAVDLWMVRYAEACAMEAACQRRENARLKKRIADLEERLEALELLLKS